MLTQNQEFGGSTDASRLSAVIRDEIEIVTQSVGSVFSLIYLSVSPSVKYWNAAFDGGPLSSRPHHGFLFSDMRSAEIHVVESKDDCADICCRP